MPVALWALHKKQWGMGGRNTEKTWRKAQEIMQHHTCRWVKVAVRIVQCMPCINTVYAWIFLKYWICWNLFWLLKITFNNKNMYLRRTGNNIISNLSNRLLIEALGVARIIIPALFFCIVNNFCTVRRITPTNYLLFSCTVKKVNSYYCGAHVNTSKTETRFKFQWFLQYRYTGYI